VAVEADEALALLQRLVHEMERRDQAQINSPQILIVVDELLDLLDANQGGKRVEAALTRLTQRGREAGLHVVAGAQKPSTALLGPLLKANFPVRLVGRVTSAEDARVASGQSGSGAEKLAGRGDFIAVTGGQTTHFQAAWIPQRDWAEVQRLIAARTSRV
jgi:S-DNA-T family DNA segregation ATPase FtsK/SpoIIIE